MIEFVIGDKVRYLPCMHTYHTDCIDDWLMRSFTCPSCMEPVDAALLVTYETNWKACAVSRNLITISKKMKESISSVMWIFVAANALSLAGIWESKRKNGTICADSISLEINCLRNLFFRFSSKSLTSFSYRRKSSRLLQLGGKLSCV